MSLFHHVGTWIRCISFNMVDALRSLDIDWLITRTSPVCEYLFAFFAVTSTELVNRGTLRAYLLSHSLYLIKSVEGWLVHPLFLLEFTRRQLRQGEKRLIHLWWLVLSELHREDTLLYHSHFPNIISVLGDLWNYRLDLIDLGYDVRVQQHVVSFLNSPHDLCKSQLCRHELLQSLLRLVNFTDRFTLLVRLIQSSSQFFLLSLTESVYLLFSLVGLIVIESSSYVTLLDESGPLINQV